MSGSAAYQYQSDNGVIYQVVLPDDFAAALGYVAATGGETYLPAYVSPRFVNYVSADKTLAVGVIVTRRDVFTVPPQVVTVGGIDYALSGAVGEKRVPIPLGQVITVAGPQGPPGPPGGTTPQYIEVVSSGSASYTVDPANGDNQLIIFNGTTGAALLTVTLPDTTVAPNVVTHLYCANGLMQAQASGGDTLRWVGSLVYDDFVTYVPVPALAAQIEFRHSSYDMLGYPVTDNSGNVYHEIHNALAFHGSGVVPDMSNLVNNWAIYYDNATGELRAINVAGTIRTLAAP